MAPALPRGEKTMSIYGRFYQVGYVTRDIDAAIAQLQARMGATLVDVLYDLRDGNGEQVALKNLSHMSLPGAEIELIEPRPHWSSIYLDALPERGDDIGFHHLGFLIPDDATWDAAMASFETFGTPVVMSGATPQVRFAYVDTRRQCGHYSEIAQRFDSASARPLP